jgi:hypothetical protein
MKKICTHPLAIWNWHCMRMTWLPHHSANHRCSSVIWILISADLSSARGTRGLLSTSLRVSRCSLLRLRDASKGPDQSTFSERQCSGSNSTSSWGHPWYTADLYSTRQPGWKEGSSRTGRAWPSLIGNGVLLYKQLIRPMMDCACPIWRSAARSCECCNPSVFESRPTHLGTLATGKFTRIWGFHSSPTTSEHWLTETFYLKLADAGKPLVLQLGRHLCLTMAAWSHPLLTEDDWCSESQSRLLLIRRQIRLGD